MREILSRIFGGIAAGASIWLADKGVNVAPEVLIGFAVAVYGVVHKVVDKKLNPADTAAKPAKAVQHLDEAASKRPLGTPLH